MRKLVLLVSILIIATLLPAAALGFEADLAALTDEALIDLKQQVDAQMKDRGLYIYIEMKSGASGEEVVALQERLVALGYLTVDPTGKYDSKTASALKAFEKASGLKQDGVASIADQELLFSGEAVPKPTPTPKPTKKPTPTPDPRKAYGRFDFNAAARYPTENIGKQVKITGRVLQVLGDRKNGFEMRVATKGRYDNVIYIVTTGGHEANILEGDSITFYCQLAGDYTYKSTMGQSITLPIALCDMYEYRK